MIGVLPGIGPLAALALLLPITFTMTPVAGVLMLSAIFYGAMYGGSTTSILRIVSRFITGCSIAGRLGSGYILVSIYAVTLGGSA